MRILETVIDKELNELDGNGVQLRHLGHLDPLQPHLQDKIRRAIEQTRHNDRLIVNLAFNYGGRDEIVSAVRRLMADGVPLEEVDEVLLDYYLFTGGQAAPDYVIRTSGEFRISNFLIWQGAYAEYYITPKYWPDFDERELLIALQEFASRKRRFGKVTAEDDE